MLAVEGDGEESLCDLVDSLSPRNYDCMSIPLSERECLVGAEEEDLMGHGRAASLVGPSSELGETELINLAPRAAMKLALSKKEALQSLREMICRFPGILM